jgi:glycosyltransferase involved in cell wall biosynthesis/O-antigen/teichoic acid export membrane protein
MKTVGKNFLGGASFLVASYAFSNGLNFLFNATLGRLLTFEEFGLITLVNSLWYLVAIFFNSVGTTITHRISFLLGKGNTSGANKFFERVVRQGGIIALITTILFVAGSSLLATFFKVDSVLPFLLFSPAILFGLLLSANRSYLHGNFKFTFVGLIVLIEACSKLGIALLLTLFGQESLAYISIPASIVLSYAVSLFYIERKKEQIENVSETIPFPKDFFGASLLTGFATTAFLTIDILLVKHFFSPELSGQYAMLSLVGKMIFFVSSLLNGFLITFVARDMGENRDPNKTFYRILGVTSFLVISAFMLLGPFGEFVVPILLGSKAYAILPYLTLYTLAIAIFSITNIIITYHLARQHYFFSIATLFMTALMAIGIMLFHNSLLDIVKVILVTSYLNFALMMSSHLFQRHGKFILRNFIDFLDVFYPLPKIATARGGKKILIFNWRDTKHTFAGGAEVYIHELAKRWVKDGNHVTVFCGNDSKSARDEYVDGVQIIRRGGFYFVYFWAFIYYIFQFRGRYDVIIDCENGIPFFTPLYAKEKKVLVIHHIHQDVFREGLIRPLAIFATFLEMKVMPYAYRNVQTITVSPSSKDDIMRFGISDEVPKIIYNGVDLKKYKPAQKHDKPLILYLGRLKHYKSVHVLINAAATLLKKIPDAQFVIAGDGEEKNNLKKLVKSLGIEDKVNFVGKVTEEEKISLFQKAWVFVNPSAMEGWGITTIEANACGTPVVASRVPGLRDAVKNPHTGYLVKYGEADAFAEKIGKLITDKKLRTYMSKNAIEWSQSFDWDKSAQEAMKLL